LSGGSGVVVALLEQDVAELEVGVADELGIGAGVDAGGEGFDRLIDLAGMRVELAEMVIGFRDPGARSVGDKE